MFILSLDIPVQSWCLPFTLSTSQTPTKLTKYYRLDRCAEGGGFGTVTDHGYGISYIVCGEDQGMTVVVTTLLIINFSYS